MDRFLRSLREAGKAAACLINAGRCELVVQRKHLAASKKQLKKSKNVVICENL